MTRLCAGDEEYIIMHTTIIHLKGMEFYAYHGVETEERTLGQRFVVDVDLYLQGDTARPDSIACTVDYAKAYTVVRECVEKEQFQLLETLADKIASLLLKSFDCREIKVEVHKPNAPIPGVIKDVSVEIRRVKET